MELYVKHYEFQWGSECLSEPPKAGVGGEYFLQPWGTDCTDNSSRNNWAQGTDLHSLPKAFLEC